MNSPRVSVIVPAYNAEGTILEALRSVQAQTLTDFELLVIDDGSTDGTGARAESLGEPRLRVLSYQNAGLAASRNRGVRAASGEFVTFLDADDLWTEDKLTAQVDALRAHPEAGVAYSWTAFIDEDGRLLHLQRPFFLAGNVYGEMLVRCFTTNGSNVMFRRTVLDDVGAYDTTLGAAEDWEYMLRTAARWPFAVVPKHQILYRRSRRSISANVATVEQTNHVVVERAFRSAPAHLQHRKPQSLAQVNLYVARLHLDHGTRPGNLRPAAVQWWRALRLYPGLARELGTYVFLARWLATVVLPDRIVDRGRAAAARVWERVHGLRASAAHIGSTRGAPPSPAGSPLKNRCWRERSVCSRHPVSQRAARLPALQHDDVTVAVAIVVPSYNATRTIRSCLTALQRQRTSTPYEVVVVDSSSDGTADLVAREFPWARLVRQPIRTYAGPARNVGIRTVAAEHYVLIDADCVADPDLVERMIARHDEGGYTGVGGALCNGTPRSPSGWLGYLIEFREFMPRTPCRLVRSLPAAAVCYPRTAFERHGYFDETAELSEDVIFNAAVTRAGGRLLFDPAIQVTHLNRTGWRAVLGYQYRNGCGAAAARRRGVREGRAALRWPALALAFPVVRFLRAARWLVRYDRMAFAVFVALAPVYLLALVLWSLGFWQEARRGDVPVAARPALTRNT